VRTRGKACLVLLVTIILPLILLVLNVAPVEPEPGPGPGALYFHREAAPLEATYGTYKKTMNASSPTYSSGNPATVILTGGAQESLVWYGPAFADDAIFPSGDWNFSFWYTADAPVNVAVLVAWFNETWGGPSGQVIVGWTGVNKINLTASSTPTEVVLSKNPGSYTVAGGCRLGAVIRNTNATLTVYYDCAGRESRIVTPAVDVTPPVAEAGGDQTVKLGEEVILDASASYDPSNGTIVSWDWDFADGTNGSGLLTTHTYMTPGVKVVTLTVKDLANLTGTDTVDVTVLDEWTDRPNVTLTFPLQYPNIIIMGWDAAQRNHLYEMLNRGELPNLRQLFTEGRLVNTTIPEGSFGTVGRDHATDTKAGWTQILTGYSANVTRVFSNGNYSEIPDGYTVYERVKAYFGGENVATTHITGKSTHVSADPGFMYYNAVPELDVVDIVQRPAYETGLVVHQALNTYGTGHFFCFFHFREPDKEGHGYGENSPEYEEAIRGDDRWLGTIVAQLKKLGVYETTYIYVAVDHGFDEGLTSHSNAPYVFLATNDPLMPPHNETWQWDVAPTALCRAGLDVSQIDPPLTGTPLAPPHAVAKSTVREGEFVDLDVIAKNHVDIPQTFNVTLYYGNETIGTQAVTDLPPGARVNLRFTWNTTGVPSGTYTITAKTSLAPNVYTDGNVTVVERGPSTLYFHRTDAPPGPTYGTYKKVMDAFSPTFPADSPATIKLPSSKSIVWYDTSPLANDSFFLPSEWNFSFWYTAGQSVKVEVLIAWFDEAWAGPNTIVGWTGNQIVALGATPTPVECVLSKPISWKYVPAGSRLGAIIRNPSVNMTLTVYYDCVGRESRIEVPGLDEAPTTAEAGANQTVKLGEEVFFDAGGSTHLGFIDSYEWDFGDGANGTGLVTTHAYTSPGTYTANLTVHDLAGHVSSDTLNVHVQDVPFERPNITLTSPPQYPNVIVLGWDGVQRDHLYEMLNRGELPNLRRLFTEGILLNTTIPVGTFKVGREHATDTKSGWAQINTGYAANITGVYSNGNFSEIPDGYTVFERVKAFFDENIVTAMITGKFTPLVANLDPGTPYANALPEIDVFDVVGRKAYVTGASIYEFLKTHGAGHYYAFFHLADPDSAGHGSGENSPQYEESFRTCDEWLGIMVAQLRMLGVYERTYIYVTADHGFDEGGTGHSNAPYIFLATNDPLVPFKNNTWLWDVAPTALCRAGLDVSQIDPPLTGTSLAVPHAAVKPQVGIGETVEIDVIAENHAEFPISEFGGGSGTTRVYVKPPSLIELTRINETFTVNICVENITDLYTWEIGLDWSPTVLECTDFREGPFLQMGGSTTMIEGTINNTAGRISPPYACTLLSPALEGVDGSGTLAYADFRVKDDGEAWINFTAETKMWDSSELEPQPIPVDLQPASFVLPPTETFNVTLRYDNETIGTQAVTDLPPGARVNLRFTWNTTGVPSGTYTITATVSGFPEIYVLGNVTVWPVLLHVAVSLPYGASAVYPGWGSHPEPEKGVNVTVTVENRGTETVDLTVTAHYDHSTIGSQAVTLYAGENATLALAWNTTDTDPCKYNYTGGYYVPYAITVNVSSPALGEVTWRDGTVTLRLPGDGSGDGWATGSDLAILGRAWYKSYPEAGYDWRADWSGDGMCTGSDLAILGRNWYKSAQPA